MSTKKPLLPKGDLSHAYLFVGNQELIYSSLQEELACRGIIFTANPDVTIINTNVFGIEQSRELRRRQSLRGLGNASQYFIVSAHGFTKEAQNALLKTLEDPDSPSYFFIIVSSLSGILETLKSRVFIVAADTWCIEKAERKDVESFLSYDADRRIKFLSTFLAHDDDSDARILSRQKSSQFLISIETVLRERDVGSYGYCIAVVEDFRRYMLMPSSHIGLIMEHLALSLPRVKFDTSY